MLHFRRSTPSPSDLSLQLLSYLPVEGFDFVYSFIWGENEGQLEKWTSHDLEGAKQVDDEVAKLLLSDLE